MQQRWQSIRPDLLILLSFLILPLALFWDVTFRGQTMLPVDNLFQWQPWAVYAAEFGVSVPHNSLLSDLIVQNYPWKLFAIESLRGGEIPLWNPNIFAGQPFLANGQHSVLYPFSLLFFVLPIHAAYGWFTVSQLWLAGVCGYVFGRILNQRRSSAAITGLVYQGAGFLLVSAAVFPMIIAAVAWLPLLLGCIEKIIRATTQDERGGNTLPWAAVGAIALGLNILAGHPEMTLYSLLIMGFYAAWRLLEITIYDLRFTNNNSTVNRKSAIVNLAKPATWLLMMVFIGMMLGSIQLIPSLGLAQTNFREGSATLADVRGWAFPPRRVLTLVLPNFFGNPAHHEYTDAWTRERVSFELNYYGNPNPHGAGSSNWGIKNYVEGGIYLGLLPLILATIAIYDLRFTLYASWSRLRKHSNPAHSVGARRRGSGIDSPERRELHVASPASKQIDKSGRGEADFNAAASSYALAASPSPYSARRMQSWFFVVLSFLALNFIFGSPLYAILYYGLPFIDQLHSPFRWVFALSICVAALAGFGMDRLLDEREGERFGRIVLNILTLGALVMMTLGTLGFILPVERIAPFFERLVVGLAQAPDAFPSGRAFFGYLAPQLRWVGMLYALGGSCLLIWRKTRYVGVLVFAIIAVDLWQANRGFHVSADPALLDVKPNMIEWLEQQPGHWRLTSFAPKDKAFNANSGWLYSFEDIRGYDSIINKQYTEYMAAIDVQDELKFNRIAPIKTLESLNSPLLDLLNVKYVITSETLDALPKYELAWEGEGVRVYENLGAMPRAYTIDRNAALFTTDPLAEVANYDPRTTLLLDQDSSGASTEPVAGSPQAANVAAYGNVEVTVEASVETASWLVLNDSFADGWRAFVRPIGGADSDEVELTIHRANGNFRAVLLDDAGDYSVRFRYSPRTFIIGGLTSFMGGIIILFAFGVWGWRRFYRQEGELTNTQSIAKNSLVPMVLNLFNKGIDFAFAAFYLRVLGPGDAGLYAAAISIALWFDIVANWGLDALIIRDVAQQKDRAGHYLYNTTILRLLTMVIGIVPVLLFVGEGFINDNPIPPNAVLALVLIAVGMIFSGVGKGLTGLFYVFESAEYPAALATVTTILKVAFGVFVLLLGWGFVGLAGVSIVTNIITLSLLAYIAFRNFPIHGPWKIDTELQKSAFRVGYPLMLNHLLATVFFKIDQPLLLRLDGEEAVGWYNSAYKWVDGFNVIPSFFTFALFPIISRQVASSMADARRTFRMAVKLLVLVALPLAAVVTLLADVMIGVVGGDEFLPQGALALRLVMWSIPIGWINSVTNYMIVSLGLERRLTFGFVIGVLFNTIGNIIFIPRFSFVAAAITTILSELVLLLMFNYYLRQRMEGVQWVGLLVRPIAVTILMVGAMWAGAQANLWLGLLLGLIVYPAGLWLLRVFGEEEQKIVAAIVPEPLRRLTGR